MESVKVHGDASLAPQRISDLFNEAVHLSSTAPPTPMPTLPDAVVDVETTQDAIESIWRAQRVLKTTILDKIPDAIRLAAAKGLTHTDVFSFHGNQKFQSGETDEYPLLFLLKGPTDPEQRHKLASDGFVPTLELLRKEVAPFDLRHSWTVGTNVNKITVSWQRNTVNLQQSKDSA
jgi:hypothetical protein